MKSSIRIVIFVVVVGSVFILLLFSSNEGHHDCETHFDFQLDVAVPGSPEQVFDLATGDIKEWWDHSFHENPKALFIEPKPGGGFYEIFDEYGNGAKHAEVIYAERGKMLRMQGPLGLSGQAIQLVMTYQFESIGQDSTQFTLNVDASGHFDCGASEIVEKVWTHFLVERFKPYVQKKLGR